MKKLLVAASIAAAAFCGAPAFAADMPMKAPSYAPWSWTGFYVGGNVGGAWGHVTNNWLPGGAFTAGSAAGLEAAADPSFHPSSFIGGGQLGYNYQTGSIVSGFEADISGLNLNSSRTASLTGVPNFAAGAFLTETAKNDFLATVRGRLGYAANNWLLYGTGGLAVGQAKYTDFLNFNSIGATQFAESSKTRTGWTLGGGVEYALAGNWSMKTEYLYIDLGKSTAVSIFPGFTITHEHGLTEQIVRIALNYKFGAPLR